MIFKNVNNTHPFKKEENGKSKNKCASQSFFLIASEPEERNL